MTDYCDLGCAFCAYSRELKRTRRTVAPARILAFCQLLSEYQERFDTEVLVSWLGGEPLIWPPLKEIAPHITQELGLRLAVTTNGTALATPAMREHLMHYDEVTISVDGLAPHHDRVRGRLGLWDDLRVGVRALRKLRDGAGRRPLLRVNTILMRGNVSDLERLCVALADWGVEEVTFNQLGGNDRPEFYPDHRLLPEQALWLRQELPRIRERLAVIGLKICGSNRYFDRILSTACGHKVPIVDCHPGESFLFIDECLRIAPCSFTSARYGVSMEEIITAQDLADLPSRFAASRRDALSACCHDCHSTQVFGKFHS